MFSPSLQHKRHVFSQLILTTKLIRENKLQNQYVISAVVGGQHMVIDDLSICPPNIISDFFCLLVIPYTRCSVRSTLILEHMPYKLKNKYH